MKTIAKITALLALALGGLTFFSSHAPTEVAQIIDQLNPLVPTTARYVKTTTPESVNGYGTATYKQLAADEEGKTRELEFNGLSELKCDRYLKLTTKGAHVETYEEVVKDQVPKKVLAALENA